MKRSWPEKLNRLRRPLLAVGAFFCCLVVFFLVWMLRVRGNGDKSLSIKWNDAYELTSPVIEEGISQEFSYDMDILGLAVYFVTEGEQPEGTLDLLLEDADTGEVLGSSVGEMSNILSGRYAGMGVGEFIDGETRTYRLTLTPHYTGSGRLCVGYSASAPEGKLTVDGQEMEGGIALSLTYNRVGGFLTRFFLLIAFAASLLLGLVVWYCTGKSIKLHLVTLALVLAFGCLYTAVLPPYASPDEQYHINQSFTVACKLANHFTAEDWHMGKVPLWTSYRRPSDRNWLVQEQDTTVFTWKVYGEQLFSRTQDAFDAHTELRESQADDKDFLYLLSGFAVFLCYLLRLGFVPTLLLGRTVNGLAYALLVSYAVKRTPVAKQAFLAAALLPMSLHVGVSFSRDCLLLGFAYLFAAICLDLLLGKKSVTPKNSWPLFALAFFLAPAKYVYVPLLLLFFLIPAGKLHRPRAMRISFAFVLALSLLVTSSFFYNRVIDPAWNVATSVTGEIHRDAHHASGVQPAAFQSENAVDSDYDPFMPEALPAEDQICYTPIYILTHPMDTVLLLVNSVLENADHYLSTLVGGSLSYYSVDIAWGWVLLLYGILAVSCISGPEAPLLSGKMRFWLGMAALACMGLAVAGCITWTPTYYTTIYGLQGRYFLPVLPVMLAALTSSRLKPAGDLAPGLVIAITITDIGVLLNAMLVIIAR